MQSKAVLYGLLGVLGFSLTLPMTKTAVAHGIHPYLITCSRALIGGLLALGYIFLFRKKIPSRKYLKSILITGSTYTVLFPLFLSLGLQNTSASHGASVFTLQPLTTAILASLRNGEKPGILFWIMSIIGILCNLLYFATSLSGEITVGDFFLVVAVIFCSLGYTEATKITRQLGSLNTICWSLIFMLPIIIPAWLTSFILYPPPLFMEAWLGVFYVGAVSQFFANIPWLIGLSLGGAARIGQVQLIQPFLTLIASYFILGEPLTIGMFSTAAIVIICAYIAIQKKAKLSGI
jgi:drug/metabolite transporter (DMT)-like permease